MSNCFILKFGLVECHFVTARSCLLTMVLSCALEKNFLPGRSFNHLPQSVFSIGMFDISQEKFQERFYYLMFDKN